MSIGYISLQSLTASDTHLTATSVEHDPYLWELIDKSCTVFLVKGGVRAWQGDKGCAETGRYSTHMEER